MQRHGSRRLLFAFLTCGLLCALFFSCRDAAKAPTQDDSSARDGSGSVAWSQNDRNLEDQASQLLARAIAALGGREVLAALRAVDIKFEAEGPGIRMNGRIRQEFPDRFRQEQQVWDATLVHVSSAEGTWKSIDGVPMAVEEDDRRQLEEQSFLARLSLLVDLQDEGVWDVEFRGRQDDLQWLKVEHNRGDMGPAYLGFDPDSALLVRTRYEALVYGHRKRTKVTLRLEDYRRVSGIMVPFQASYTVVGEKLALRTRIREIVMNPARDDALFEEPRTGDDPAVFERAARSFRAVVLAEWGGTTSEGEKRIKKAIDQNGLERIGPLHVMAQDPREKTVNLAYPVVLPQVAEPPGLGEDLSLLRIDHARVLTTIVRSPSDETLAKARERLAEYASKGGHRLTGDLRHVIWSPEITQLQVVVN